MKADLSLRRKYLRAENLKWPAQLAEVPRSEWPGNELGLAAPLRTLRSRTFLVQVFQERNEILRLSINRTELNATGGWKDGITWDELQRLKEEAGYGAWQAVELYPPTGGVVNVANMRHLWVLPEPLPFAWNRPVASAPPRLCAP